MSSSRQRLCDPRNVRHGRLISVDGYCDQPYLLKTDDGAWLCALTTGKGREGNAGQHIVAMRSNDRGETWTDRVDIEPASGPEASYSVLLKSSSGRIYCLYNYNSDNVREVAGSDPPYEGGRCRRVDSLGNFVFRFSDDGGRMWSAQRYEIPIREFEIDRENPYGGKIRFGWNVGRPLILNGTAYVPYHKVGGFGVGFFTRSEGVLLRSENILTESDPTKIRWETLPDGDVGLRAPDGGGPVAEEQSVVNLSNGTLYSIYRTVDGQPACATSRDGGHSWSTPRYECYPDGRSIRQPRAANFVWKCANGKYLYWFHNNAWNGYNNGAGSGSRNIAWLCGGVEQADRILWSQPEIVLYAPDFFSGPSYPDLLEETGRYYLSETQKTDARIYELDTELVEGLWSQFGAGTVTRKGLLLELAGNTPLPASAPMPLLPEFATRNYWENGAGCFELGGGFTLDMSLHLDSLEAGQVLLDSRTESGVGMALLTTSRGTLELILNDERSESRWDCDRNVLQPGKKHCVSVIVDSGSRVISFVIDGKLCDGSGQRMYGWGRFNPMLRHANGSKTLQITPCLSGGIHSLRIYDRYLRTSEAVGNFNAECGGR